jgi:hypothetical protein
MKYTVSVQEFVGDDINHSRSTWHYFSGRTLTEAWQLCEKHARRGVKRFGGRVNRDNWGMKGGQFPDAYRSAVIRLDSKP